MIAAVPPIAAFASGDLIGKSLSKAAWMHIPRAPSGGKVTAHHSVFRMWTCN
jgi:hypothetical protein